MQPSRRWWRIGGAVGTAFLAAVIAPGCGGEKVAVDSLPLRQSFDECNAFTMNDDVAKVTCGSGRMRIAVSRPEVSSIHFVPFRFGSGVSHLAVSTTLKSINGDGLVGVACDRSAAGEPLDGYAFFLETAPPSVLLYRVGHKSADGGRYVPQFTLLGYRRLAVASGRHRVAATCSHREASKRAVLRMTVDGQPALDVVEADGIGSYRAAAAVVAASVPQTAAEFEQLAADRTDGLTRTLKAAANPLDHRYAIATTFSSNGQPVSSVALGDKLFVVVSVDDLARDEEVPFQLCVGEGTRRVCTDERLDGGSSFPIFWTVDPGEGANGRFKLSVRVRGREVASKQVAFSG